MTGQKVNTLAWHSQGVHSLLESGGDAHAILTALQAHGCLTFPQLASGLFPAIQTNVVEDKTGYANAWLRDSSCIALGLLAHGEHNPAARAVQGVLRVLREALPTIEKALMCDDSHLPDELRIPSRFEGEESTPRSKWANAQNDAIGYALLLIGESVYAGNLELTQQDKALIVHVLEYLEHIRYWEDEDSGHWEEVRKCNASSIGVVLAGIRAIQPILRDSTLIESLTSLGMKALEAILPYETRGGDHERPTDAALIFLVEPLGIVKGDMADRIIADVEENLAGEIGIARYRGDSYWAPDYRSHFALGVRASDFSNESDMQVRNAYLTPGSEAQWTLFDSLLAIYYARKGGATSEKRAQYYLLRALGQIIEVSAGEWRMPEAFFRECGSWVPNDHVGLLWAQVNLLRAIDACSDLFPLSV